MTISSPQIEKMIVEVYPLGLLDFETAEILAKGLMSSEAKLVSDKANNRLILFDYPEKQQALGVALTKVQVPNQNVRIQVSFKDHTSSDAESLNGRFRIGGVTVIPPEHSEGRFRSENSSLSSLVQQELLIISGGRGSLLVATEVPYEEWLWSYGLQQGFWITSSIRWKDVGAKLIVEPYVMGNKVRVRLIPEFSYLIDNRRLSTIVEQLTTEVIVESGQEIDLGGIPAQDHEFYSRFLVGYDIRHERRSLHITLKPTIESIQNTFPSENPAEDQNVGRFRK